MVHWRTVQKQGRRRQLGASSANFVVAVARVQPPARRGECRGAVTVQRVAAFVVLLAARFGRHSPLWATGILTRMQRMQTITGGKSQRARFVEAD
jgi:hypothetical protein